MLTRKQIEAASAEELEQIKARLEEELERRRKVHETRAPRPRSGREVIGGARSPSGYHQLEKVRCGKASCKGCAEGPSHGPYLYLYYREGGRMRSEYANNKPEHVAAAVEAGIYESAGLVPPRPR